MTVRFLRPAKAEFDEAMASYRLISPGLAGAFAADVVGRLQQVDRYPLSSPEVEPHIRQTPLRRFPFVLLHTCTAGDVVVLAVAHMRRRPRRWRDRLREG